MNRIKIMTFNLKHIIKEDIFWFWKKRYKAIVEFIKEEEPDILGVQELTTKGKKYLRSNLKKYRIIGKKRHSIIFTNEYNCLLIKKDFKITNYKTYSLSDKITRLGRKAKTDKFPRICTLAHLEKDNIKYFVINTHIDNSDKENKKRLLNIFKNIIEKFKDDCEYIIITGDFNMTIDNKNLKEFAKDYIDPFKEYVDGTFPERKELKAIDHIFLDKRFKIINEKIYKDSNEKEYMSDHNPISCDISLN